MQRNKLLLALVAALPLPPCVQAQALPSPSADAPVKSLGVVTITSGQPTSLPTQIPTTIEGVTREQIDQTINATDSEDVLKYFPSLLVRRRYIGDYNHAVLSTRASGTSNSARSAVYADGILLSNYLGNGPTYAPRWGMVSPEEIERVDVMYGPFSAAYPGNSVGAVVDYETRMPTQFEGSAKLINASQKFWIYNSNDTYIANQAVGSLGSRSGDWAWKLELSKTDSNGQPMVFATKNSITAGTGTAVTGAVSSLDKTFAPWYVVGTNTQYHTLQTQGKLKLSYDLTPTLTANYLLGVWNNQSDGNPSTYLRDAAGNPIYGGKHTIDGSTYQIDGTFNASRETLEHLMHGLSLKSRTKGVWDWEVAANSFEYGRDLNRATTVNAAATLSGGAGTSATITDQKGTGWNTFAAKGTWRPDGMGGAHIADMGMQQENYRLRILKSDTVGDWSSGDAGKLNTDVGGKTQMQSVFAQDTWAFAPAWKTVLGLRLENWSAVGGFTRNATSSQTYADRNETYASPKAALAFQATPDTTVKLSTGRAVRMPTVQELYGATTGTLTVVNDPDLRPEKSWTTELTAERDFGNSSLRVTWFQENVRDSIYSESLNPTTTRITNVDAINTTGLEVAFQGTDNFVRGLDISGSVTYADSRIAENAGYVVTPGDTIGKYQPRVPVWRASVLTNYRWNDRLNTSIGVRYSGDQYSSLNNADVNGFAYTAASRFTVVDVRLRYAFGPKVVGALGIDNLTDQEY